MVPNDFVAIRSVRFVGEPDALFRIQSGITSVQVSIIFDNSLLLIACLHLNSHYLYVIKEFIMQI